MGAKQALVQDTASNGRGHTRTHSGRRSVLVLSLLFACLLVCLVFAAAFGAVPLSPLDIVKMTLNQVGVAHFTVTWPDSAETILFHIRLPRVTAAAFVGAALAAAGVLFQGLLRNPMADPYIIGTSAGAAFGATLAMMLPVSLAFAGFGLVPVAAFLGAMGAVLLVYNVARVGGKTPIVSMLLAGFAVSAMLAAAMSLLITLSDRLQLRLHSVFSFLMGGIAVSDWSQLAVLVPLIIAGIVAARFFAFRLNAFSLGEEGAAYLGIEVERDKLLILGVGSLLTGAAVSMSGLIGFVGLMVPHAVRMVLGPDHRLLLPASALVGAGFLVLADLLARVVIAPEEMPVGIITALIGAPFFIYLLRRTGREYAF
ncbi:MAG: iron chelate uptake ABC transporter family permease subunit [Chloroflexota bacterium]|nr:iron chelate uptake ABC transporter family permease subunit [Chloroflexota bacterium]